MRSSLPLQVGIAIVALSLGLMALGPKVFVEDAPISISGYVTLDGKPLKIGTIRFFSEGTPQPACDVSLIEDGEYSISNSESLVPATYQVHISGLGANPPLDAAEPLPSRYNQNSILRVEIKRKGSHRFNFELKS